MYRSRSLRKPSDREPNPDTDSRTISPSRLPVKPLHRTASTVGPARQPATRTGTGLTRAASTRDDKRHAPPSRTVSAAQPRSVTSRTRPQAGASGIDGTATTTRARAGTVTGAGHTRTRSTTLLSGAPTLRPPTQPTRIQQPPPAQAPTRQPSHARTKSSTAALSNGPSLRAPSQPKAPAKPQSQAAAVPRAVRPPAAPLRPAFNNNQQHYSPARNNAPKPLTASYLAPPSPGKLPANVAISAETLRLQNDLLRHHVLHASAAAATGSWHASAEGKLGARFGALAAESKDLSSEESRLLEDLNVVALRRWGGGPEEKVQGLDALLAAVWRVSEPGGKHARLARRFERWAERAREAEEARSSGGILDGDEPALVGGLGTPWKDEVGALTAKLEGWRKQAEGLRYAPREEDGSNLEGILKGCEGLVEGMLAELNLMLEIEGGVVRKEREWVRSVIGSVGDEGTGAGAIWRTT